jgi:peptide chain release factor subunit 3
VKGLEDEDICRGQIICSLGENCLTTYEIEAELKILTLPEHKSILSAGYQCILHLHCAIEDVSISQIICSIEDGKKNPK